MCIKKNVFSPNTAVCWLNLRSFETNNTALTSASTVLFDYCRARPGVPHGDGPRALAGLAAAPGRLHRDHAQPVSAHSGDAGR